MPTQDDRISKLFDFKQKDKFSVKAWENRGLNPSNNEICEALNSKFNIIADVLIDDINNDNADKQLKSTLKSELKSFDRYDYDTEEKEFICDVFYEISNIVHINIEPTLNKWLYGNVLNTLLSVAALIKTKQSKETISQPCIKCAQQLETYIIRKQEGIPDTSWFVVKCNNCNELNLLSLGPNIKELKFGNYQQVDILRKDEYTLEHALARLDQIKAFRK